MLNIDNDTIKNFIENFERVFGDYLDKPRNFEPRSDRKKPTKTKHSTVLYPGPTKYSDWDLHMSTKKELLTKETVSEMEKFIRDFPQFSLQGLLLTDLRNYGLPLSRDDKNLDFYHHIETIEVIHFMSYLMEERERPLVDIHIEPIPNNLLREVNSKFSKKEYIDWILITCWRKYKQNGDLKYQKWMLPILNVKERREFLQKPNIFIKNYLETRGSKDYSEIITLLTH